MPEIKIRVDSDIKAKFDEACSHKGLTISQVLRDAIADFTSNNKPSPLSSVTITRPKNYDLGAWRVEAKVLDPDKIDRDIKFHIPKLKSRIFNIDEDHIALFNINDEIEIGGILKNGIWKANFYTNGCKEEDNKTSIAKVQLKLEMAIDKAIRTYFPE